jgi:hypothetical protein
MSPIRSRHWPLAPVIGILLASCVAGESAGPVPPGGDPRPDAPQTGPVAQTPFLRVVPLDGVPEDQPGRYCRVSEDRTKLIATLRNDGGASYAGGGDLIVRRPSGPTSPPAQIPGLGIGESYSPGFERPPECYRTETRCRFTIEYPEGQSVEGECISIL